MSADRGESQCSSPWTCHCFASSTAEVSRPGTLGFTQMWRCRTTVAPRGLLNVEIRADFHSGAHVERARAQDGGKEGAPHDESDSEEEEKEVSAGHGGTTTPHEVIGRSALSAQAENQAGSLSSPARRARSWEPRAVSGGP